MSTEPNRSLRGVSLPQWMKSKINDRYDLEGGAFSPPSQDDGFLIMRYNKSRSKSPEMREEKHSDYKPIGEALSQTVSPNANDQAIVKHTEPCQEFIPQAKFSAREIGLRHVASDVMDKVKSTGTDDGYSGESAACGYSVLAVAQTMVSHGGSGGGKGWLDVGFAPAHRNRRNSQSLPTSPLSSPKLFRRNPFFTDPLFGSSEISRMGSEMNRSEQDIPIIRAKPSQLREMNFLSPTSM